jgi:hypothetical protein
MSQAINAAMQPNSSKSLKITRMVEAPLPSRAIPSLRIPACSLRGERRPSQRRYDKEVPARKEDGPSFKSLSLDIEAGAQCAWLEETKDPSPQG